MSWAATGAMLSGIGSIGSAIAIIGAAILGKSAVKDYREEKRAEREMEVAEKSLAAAYNLKSAYDSIRNPMSSAQELQSSEDELVQTDWFPNEPEDRKQQVIQANVFFQRIRRFSSEFDEALSLIPLLKAYFGVEAGEAMERLIRSRNSVSVYADAYAKNDYGDADHTRKIQRTIWRSFSPTEEDPVQVAIDAAIAELEAVLTPILRSTIEEARK